MFRRRKGEPSVEPSDALGADAVDEVDEVEGVDVEAAAEAEEPPASSYDRSSGPFDAGEQPDDGVTRLDLGGLRVAGAEGMEIRLEVDEASQNVVAVTIVTGDSALQLTAFAAPRTEGIWDDVRREIRGNLAAGGTVDELEGPFGLELQATISQPGPDGRVVTQPVRFVGVDGPRWFLRGLFTGRAAREGGAAAPLEAAMRATVVVRGGDAMAPGDALPLSVPTAVPEGMSRGETGTDRRTPLPPPERGPEITEIR